MTTPNPTTQRTALVANASAWASDQGRHAVSQAPRPVRDGAPLSASEFGRLIRWGQGPEQAEELLRDLRGIVRARPGLWHAYANRLRDSGITLEIAASWAAAYLVAAGQTPPVGGVTAPARAALMRFLVEELAALWWGCRVKARWFVAGLPLRATATLPTLPA